MKGLREALSEFIPNWMTRRPGFEIGFRWLWAMALPFDILEEILLQGINAWAPGSPGATPTALPIIGRSRGLIQGELETDDHFAMRLRAWLTTWNNSGSDAVVASLIQEYLGNRPAVTIIKRAGLDGGGHPLGSWYKLAADGTVTRTVALWDWDSHAPVNPNDPAAPWWSDLWIVIYPTEWPITGATLASLVGVWGTSDLGLGHKTTRRAVDAILGIIKSTKGAHTYVRAIIWNYDPLLFDPANPSHAGNPDGWWFNWGKDVASVRVPSRNPTCRYWTPAFEPEALDG